MDYQPRIVDTQVKDALGAMGAVVIEGPKACGKTATARRHAVSEVLLDLDPDAARAAAVDPRLVLDGPTPRLIDEWQRQPATWDAVRRAVDDRGAPGQFVLTGSSVPSHEAVRHSGAGRMTTITMRPMALFEQHVSSGLVSLGTLLDGGHPVTGRTDVELTHYVERIVVGGWPGLLGRSVPTATQFARGYLDMTVDHDIELVTGSRRDPRLLRRFLHAYAQVTSHPSRLSTILERARGDAPDEPPGPSRWAAEPYLDALRRLMVVDDVEPWDPELRSRTRLMSTPKRHLVDPSLAVALLGCGPDRLLRDVRTLGFLFESLVARDIRVYAAASNASTYHYRERSGDLEVDLVVERRDGAWVGIEVKLGAALMDQAASALLRLAGARVVRPPAALMVVTTTPYAYRRDDAVWVVPLAMLGP
ncbi:MAG: ATP-binding protein [Acidimicrobiales bacterium]